MTLSVTRTIRDEADLRWVEAAGLDAFLTAPSPFAILRQAAARWPRSCAIRYLPGGEAADQTVDFATLFGHVTQAASLFRALGADAAHSVALLGPNTLWAQVALWGAEVAGGACPINPALSEDAIAVLLRTCQARVAVVLGRNGELEVLDRANAAIARSGLDIVVLTVDGEADGASGFAARLAAQPVIDWPDPDPDATAALYPTGGTTGAPKLTRHSHRNEAFVATAAARMYDLQPGEVVLNGFPLFHVAGAFVYGLSAVFAGAAQVIPGRLGMRNRAFVDALWAQVHHYGITRLSLVPTLMSGMLSRPAAGAPGPVRAAYTGGSLLPTALADAFEHHTGVPVRNVLGMTECSGMMTTEPLHAPRTPGSVGLRLPFTRVAVERADGSAAAPGETGLVVTQGPHVSPGYADGEARDAFRPDGTLCSGDLGWLDADGRLFIVGRSKDVIIRGSHNIDPAAIEDALQRHPAVAIAAAVGQPDHYAGELPVAFVTLHPGAAVTEAELCAFAAAGVSDPTARPKMVWIIATMPLTPVGKVFKPSLRQHAARHAVAQVVAALEMRATVTADDQGVRVICASDEQAIRLRAALVGMPIAVDCRSAAAPERPSATGCDDNEGHDP